MDELKKISELATLTEGRPNVWTQPTVSVEPEKFLTHWSIAKAVSLLPESQMELGTFHFVGYESRYRQGAVSSIIKHFDSAKMQGTTMSGRVYQLVGVSGFNIDAAYVLGRWSEINRVEVLNATDEFFQIYGIGFDKPQE